MSSKVLAWARKQGLNCELDIMAAQLRQTCVNTTWLFAIVVLLAIDIVVAVFK